MSYNLKQIYMYEQANSHDYAAQIYPVSKC